MASFFNLELDTTAPASPSILLAGGAQYANAQVIAAAISTGDGDTTGYQIKVWGDLDLAYNANMQDTEGNSSWVSFDAAPTLKLLTGDGSKTVNVKIRDDVYNESTPASDTIILDTTQVVVTISGPDLSVISKVAGKNVSAFSFTTDAIFEEYKVKVVASSGASHDSGTLIGTANGSTNMSGSAGAYPSATPINCQINGTDLETADSGDNVKIIKVFVKDAAENWSV